MKPFSAATLSDGVRAVSDDLATTLTTRLSKSASGTLRLVSAELKSGNFEGAKATARDLEFTPALDKADKVIRKFTRSAALVGAGAIDQPSTSLFATSGVFPFEIDKSAVRLTKSMIDRSLTTETIRRILAQINRAERFQKAADPLDPDVLANQINRYLRGEIRRVVDVSSNVVGTRVSAYGMFYEARARGISRYRIDAVLDDRTTDICREMDGRTFEVEQSYTRAGLLLSITDPSEQKKEAPFPELENIQAKTNEELQAMGIHTPPFHFLCRSVVTLIDTKKEYEPVPSFPRTQREDSRHQAEQIVNYTARALSLFNAANEADLFNAALKALPVDGILGHVSAYTGNLFNPINQRLRLNRPWEDGSELPTTVLALDNLMTQPDALAPAETFAYRGVKPQVAERMEIGRVFQDDAFVSVSLAPEVAADFSSGAKTVMHIQIAEGMPALPVFPASLTPAEYELLLPRGSQFRVIGREQRQIDGETVEVIRVVYQGQGDTLSVDRIGLDSLPEAESVIRTEPGHADKFVYGAGDLREATFI